MIGLSRVGRRLRELGKTNSEMIDREVWRRQMETLAVTHRYGSKVHQRTAYALA
jgi:hypothetical protein